MAFTQLPFHPMTSEIGAQSIYSPAFDVGGMTELDVVVKVNMTSGATFDVDIEHSMDMKDWYTLGTVMVNATTATSVVKSLTDFMRYVRAETRIETAAGYATYSILGIAKDAG